MIIETLKQAGQYEQAEHLINETRTRLLAKLTSLFTELRDHVRDVQREIAVILVSDRRQFAISVDMALAIENSLRRHRRNPSSGGDSAQRRCSPACQAAERKDLVLLIETDSLMTGVDVARAFRSGTRRSGRPLALSGRCP